MEGCAFHSQQDGVPRSVAHKERGGDVPLDVPVASVPELKRAMDKLQNIPRQPELAPSRHGHGPGVIRIVSPSHVRAAQPGQVPNQVSGW